jgi:Pyruvate/2-oxoacid:ferredoxin oxidoreductase delta subunit
LGAELSKYGVHTAVYTGSGCTGCGACFYCCPEPGAITVYRLAAQPKTSAGVPKPENEVAYAPAV